jgi:pimeloyl-ACP methyl ester carboxylesterase
LAGLLPLAEVVTREVTVILDESCGQLVDAVSAFAPVQVFRRRDGFRSDPLYAADELHAMLADRSLCGVAVYVAPSFAAFTALLLAHRHAGSLAGILLLDPSHPRQGEAALAVLAEAPPSEAVTKLRDFLSGFGPVWDRSCREVMDIHTLGDLPISVLAGGRFDLLPELPSDIKIRLVQDRQAMLAEYARLSTDGEFDPIAASGHAMARDVPEAVLMALRRLVQRVAVTRPTGREAGCLGAGGAEGEAKSSDLPQGGSVRL